MYWVAYSLISSCRNVDNKDWNEEDGILVSVLRKELNFPKESKENNGVLEAKA